MTSAPKIRQALFRQIHEIVFHGKGGYDWHTIYNMPIWLRRFTYSEMQSFYSEEKKSVQNAKNGNKGTKTLVSNDGKVDTPSFLQESKAYKNKINYK